jgi:hypothetical protein
MAAKPSTRRQPSGKAKPLFLQLFLSNDTRLHNGRSSACVSIAQLCFIKAMTEWQNGLQ